MSEVTCLELSVVLSFVHLACVLGAAQSLFRSGGA